VTYNWEAPEFPDCQSSCGLSEATLTRVVSCMASDGNEAAVETSCTEIKPVGTKACAATEACVQPPMELIDGLALSAGPGLLTTTL
jgi:hypothetical protein